MPTAFGRSPNVEIWRKCWRDFSQPSEPGLHPIKINAVIERGVNDGDILELVEFSREHGFALRFIEFMDVGNSNSWKSERMVSKKEILAVIDRRYPLREVGREQGTAPSVDYEFVDGQGDIGVIASVTEPFCSSCTRARLTADGKLVTCLFSETGHDLKSMLRRGATDDGSDAIHQRRLAEAQRSVFRRTARSTPFHPRLPKQRSQEDRNDQPRGLTASSAALECLSAELTQRASSLPSAVIPAKAGIQISLRKDWIPAFAGMTESCSRDCPSHKIHSY